MIDILNPDMMVKTITIFALYGGAAFIAIVCLACPAKTNGEVIKQIQDEKAERERNQSLLN